MPPIRTLALVIAAFLAAALPAACSKTDPNPPPLILVEVAPLVSMVTPLVPPGTEVRPIVPVGVSPHGYQLPPSAAADLARASLVITVGTGIDPEIARAIAARTPPDRVFDMAKALDIHASDHDHAADDESHDHEPIDPETDPHLWLDPGLMPDFVRALDARLAEDALARPDHAGFVKTLLAGVELVDGRYRIALSPYAGRGIVTQHGAFARLVSRYGLHIAAVVRPVPSVEPTAADLAEAVSAVERTGAKAVFTEPQFSDALPKRLADETGVTLIPLDPVGSDDWIELMFNNLAALQRGLAMSYEPAPITETAEPEADHDHEDAPPGSDG